MCVFFSDISAPELKCLSLCNASSGSPSKCSMPATTPHGSISSYVSLCFLMGVELVDHATKHTHSRLQIGRVGFLSLKVYKACFKSADSFLLYCCQVHFYSWGDALNLTLL